MIMLRIILEHHESSRQIKSFASYTLSKQPDTRKVLAFAGWEQQQFEIL